MRALFSGRWGDTWLFDILIGGLKDSNKGWPTEQVEIVTDGTPTSERAGAMALARHRLDSMDVGVAGAPQIVFVCHDKLPYDEEELKAIMGFLEDGIPVYHVRHLDRITVKRLLSSAVARRTPRVPVRVPGRKRKPTKKGQNGP